MKMEFFFSVFAKAGNESETLWAQESIDLGWSVICMTMYNKEARIILLLLLEEYFVQQTK